MPDILPHGATSTDVSPPIHRVTARALALGARLDAAGLERPDTISVNPLAFSVGHSGFVALYRFGVAVLVGLSPVEEDDFLRQIRPRVTGERERVDDETALFWRSRPTDRTMSRPAAPSR